MKNAKTDSTKQKTNFTHNTIDDAAGRLLAVQCMPVYGGAVHRARIEPAQTEITSARAHTHAHTLSHGNGNKVSEK